MSLDKNYQGTDADLETSLEEYGFVARPIKVDYEDEYFVIYKMGDNQYGSGHIRESELDAIVNGSEWASEEDVASMLDTIGATKEEWFKLSFTHKFSDLVSYWGTENIIGTDYYPNDKKWAFEEIGLESDSNDFEIGGRVDNCIEYIKNSESIKNNGYYLHIDNMNNYVGSYTVNIPKIDSLCLITFNSGGQKNLKAVDTINSILLASEIAKLLNIDIEMARIIVYEQTTYSKPFTMDMLDGIKNKNIIVADRDTIVCTNLSMQFADGGEAKKLGVVKVIFENPEYNYTTNVAVNVTEEEARKYFVGEMVDVGVYPKENMQKIIDIEFSKSKDNYADGGDVNYAGEGVENTFVNVLLDYGFVEKRSSYGVRHFYNKFKNSYASLDDKQRMLNVYIDDDMIVQGRDYNGYSIRELINFLKTKEYESGFRVTNYDIGGKIKSRIENGKPYKYKFFREDYSFQKLNIKGKKYSFDLILGFHNGGIDSENGNELPSGYYARINPFAIGDIDTKHILKKNDFDYSFVGELWNLTMLILKADEDKKENKNQAIKLFEEKRTDLINEFKEYINEYVLGSRGEYANGGSVKGIKKKAEKLLEERISYRWKNTDMGSGWLFQLESPLDRSVFNLLEEKLYLDEFSPDDMGIEDYDELSEQEQDYYYEDWKEELLQSTFEVFKEKCMKHLDDFIEYIQQAKEYQDEMNEYAEGGRIDKMDKFISELAKKNTKEFSVNEYHDFRNKKYAIGVARHYFTDNDGSFSKFDTKLGDALNIDFKTQGDTNKYAKGGGVDDADWIEESLIDLQNEVDMDDLVVENSNNNHYTASNGDAEFEVFETEDDARERAIERVKEDLEENPEYFSKDWLMNYIDGEDFFTEVYNEWNESYANDIESEDSDKYANRLIEEMVENGIVSSEEAKEDGFDAEDYKDAFVELMTSNQMWEDNGLEHYIDNFGEEQAFKVVSDNNLIDIDKASESAVDTDGVAHFLSSYDGEQIDLSNGHVAYRTN